MTAKTKDEQSALAEKILPIVARKKMVENPATHVGASRFYDVAPGWEVNLMQQDGDVGTVRTPREMERAFADPDVKTVFIPSGAAITRQVACRICERSGLGKTVFYETESREEEKNE